MFIIICICILYIEHSLVPGNKERNFFINKLMRSTLIRRQVKFTSAALENISQCTSAKNIEEPKPNKKCAIISVLVYLMHRSSCTMVLSDVKIPGNSYSDIPHYVA